MLIDQLFALPEWQEAERHAYDDVKLELNISPDIMVPPQSKEILMKRARARVMRSFLKEAVKYI